MVAVVEDEERGMAGRRRDSGSALAWGRRAAGELQSVE